MHEYLEVEKAAIDKLTDMKTAGIIKTLAPYAGELDEAAAKNLTGMTNLAPFVYIAPGIIRTRPAGGMDEIEVKLIVLAGCRCNLAPGAQIKGGDEIYNLLEALKSRLDRKTIANGWLPLRRETEYPVSMPASGNMAVYIAVYSTSTKR